MPEELELLPEEQLSSEDLEFESELETEINQTELKSINLIVKSHSKDELEKVKTYLSDRSEIREVSFNEEFLLEIKTNNIQQFKELIQDIVNCNLTTVIIHFET